jgi:hypothetical protein
MMRFFLALALVLATAATAAEGLGRPETPRDLRAYLAPGERVRITWRDSSKDEDGFEIERKTIYMGEADTFRQIHRAARDATDYTHVAPIKKEETQYFRIRAFNSRGASAYSNVAVFRR